MNAISCSDCRGFTYGDLLRIVCLMYFGMGHRLVDMYIYQKSKFGGVRLSLIWWLQLWFCCTW
jgi:hypothetical protein